MDSPLKVDVKALREDAVRRAEAEFADAKTTMDRHNARRVLARARRAAGGEHGKTSA